MTGVDSGREVATAKEQVRYWMNNHAPNQPGAAASTLLLKNVLLNVIYYGITLGGIPWALLRVEALFLRRTPHPELIIPSLFVCAVGVMLQAWSIVVFHRRGKGTASPFAPPQQLVTVGPYAYVRNPMNIGEILVLLALAGIFASPALLGYAMVAGIVFHLFVLFWEEPRNRKRYGKIYSDYCAKVNRWIPSCSPRLVRADNQS